MFVGDLNLDLEDVVLKVALFLRPIWEDHLAVAVLNATDPLTLVTAAIRPVHFAVAVALVLSVLAFVDVPTGPLEHTIAVLTIV